MDDIKNKYNGSYSEIFKIAIPLILCNSTATIQFFIDRVFLSHYSDIALAASFPAGITAFTVGTFFYGVTGYVNTFVAQYEGAKQRENIGSSLWQGIYFSLITGLPLTLILIPLASPFFNLIGHESPLPKMETSYFQIVILGFLPTLLLNTLYCFYSGRGKTYPLIFINVVIMIVNISCNYLLIFGKFGFPELGINGAALGTIISEFVGFFMILFFIFRKENVNRYGLLSNTKFDKDLFRRLIKYGFPAGVQFLIDMTGFNIFILLIGRLGTTGLAATNIAFNVNLFAFMPMLGFSVATTTLVGQYIGRNDPTTAMKSVKRCFMMTIIYMSIISLSYIIIPDVYVNIYGAEKDLEKFEEIRKIAIVLLKFVAFYSIFDTLNIIYNSALRGAGDTFFIMIVLVISSITLVIIPTYLTCVVFKTSIYVPWIFFTLYVTTVGIIFYFRYRHGKWKEMKVI